MYMDEGGIKQQSLRSTLTANRPAVGPHFILMSSPSSTLYNKKKKKTDEIFSASHKENKLCPYQLTYLPLGIFFYMIYATTEP